MNEIKNLPLIIQRVKQTGISIMLEIWTLSNLEVSGRTLNRWFSRQEEHRNDEESDAAQGSSTIGVKGN